MNPNGNLFFPHPIILHHNCKNFMNKTNEKQGCHGARRWEDGPRIPFPRQSLVVRDVSQRLTLSV